MYGTYYLVVGVDISWYAQILLCGTCRYYLVVHVDVYFVVCVDITFVICKDITFVVGVDITLW